MVPGFRKPAALLRKTAWNLKSSHLRAGLRCSKDFDVTQWAGVVYRYYVCFPSMRGGFDSRRPHHPQKKPYEVVLQIDYRLCGDLSLRGRICFRRCWQC